MAYSKGSLNKVMLIGNLGADPELRTLPDGGAVANFVVATTEGWTDKNSNERKEQTEWHRITFFGKAAEIIHQYGSKGSKIYVEGTLRTRKWKDRDGNDRYTTEVRGDDFTFLSFNRPDSEQSRTQGGNYSQEHNPQNNPQQKQPAADNVFNDIEDDDIPF